MLDNLLSNRSLVHELFLKRPESIAELLPYDEYLEKDKIFLLKDGSIGAFLKLETIEHEPLKVNELEAIISSMKYWFQFPSNYSVQLHYEISPYSTHDPWLNTLHQKYSKGNATSKFLFLQKHQSLKKAENLKNMPLNRHAYLSIRYFGASVKDQSSLHRQIQNFSKDLTDLKFHLKNLIDNDRISISLQDNENLLKYLRQKFNPVSFARRSFAKASNNCAISKQIVFCSPKLSHLGIEREGIYSRTLSLKNLPNFSFPGGMAELVNINFPFGITINVSFPDSVKINKFLATKEFFLDNALSAKARIQKEEVQDIQVSLAKEDRCLQVTFVITIDGESTEELDEKSRKISQIFLSKLDCELIEEDSIGLGLWFNSLPLNYTPDADLSTQRSIKVLQSDLLNFIPIFDSFKGMKNPLAVHLSREQNIVPFSLIENETSNHTVVLADTGAGKSAFVIDCIQTVKRLSPEPIVFVIDKKSSYGMLSHYFDGELTVFEKSGDLSFSPFRGRYTEEKVTFLTKLIAMAVTLTSPSFKMESEHLGVLGKAIREAHRKKQNQAGLEYMDGELISHPTDKEVELNMSDVVTELASMSKENATTYKTIIEPLCAKLRPFYGDGIYASYFKEGKSTSSNKNRKFFIYDLDALDGDQTLQTLMTMSVIEEIRDTLSLPENAGRTGFLIMEEFAMLGRNNPAFRDFAIDFAETMRKRGCWLITLTPRPQNYFELEVGQAFWSVADNFIFLQMSSDNVDYISKKSTMFDEANSEIIRSLRTKKGQYADVYYMNKSKSKQGAFRFRQTPYDRWLSPTNALDTKRALDALKEFPDKWEALEYLVRTYPNS